MRHKSLLNNTIYISLGFVFVYYAVFGPHGVAEYCRVCQKVNKENLNIERLSDEISHLKDRIIRYSNDSFEIEKIARYDLCMGYTNELVYILSHDKNIEEIEKGRPSI